MYALTNAPAIGCSHSEALAWLVRSDARISALFVFEYEHPPLLQQRLPLTSDEQGLVEKGCLLRSTSSLPFWESLMLSFFDEPRDYSRLLQEGTFHQSHRSEMERVPRRAVLDGRLEVMAGSLSLHSNLSFSSRIEMNGSDPLHLPLLDFHCPESPANDRLVLETARCLFKGVVLIFASGESYHAIGLDMMSGDALASFLARSLLFSPIVDSRYVAHQMLEGACALRLTQSPEKPTRPLLKLVLKV